MEETNEECEVRIECRKAETPLMRRGPAPFKKGSLNKTSEAVALTLVGTLQEASLQPHCVDGAYLHCTKRRCKKGTETDTNSENSVCQVVVHHHGVFACSSTSLPCVKSKVTKTTCTAETMTLVGTLHEDILARFTATSSPCYDVVAMTLVGTSRVGILGSEC